jgi:hypothetical protein
VANSILSPLSMTSFFDNANGTVKTASLYFYKAQTLDPLVVYTDAVMAIPFPQPVVTTGYGQVPPVYVGEIPAPGYRCRVFDQYQVLIADLDNLPGAEPDPSSVPPPVAVDPNALWKTGDVKSRFSNHESLPGWVECSGKSIGSAASNATGRANDDCHALFLHLWQQDAYNLLPVLPSKGASAEGDWQANKTIATPDAWGRMLGGVDGHDTANDISISGRLDDGLFGFMPGSTTVYQKPWQIGASGGEDVHKLVVTELAVHLHDWIDLKGHSHYVLEPTDGLGRRGHLHSIDDPRHAHGIETSDPGSNGVLGRATASQTVGLPTTTPFNWAQVGLSINLAGTGIQIIPHVTGILMRNQDYASTDPNNPGRNQVMQYIGTYNTTDLKWHNPTENQPLVNDGSNGTGMGDRPHNTLAPFLLLCVYIKLAVTGMVAMQLFSLFSDRLGGFL